MIRYKALKHDWNHDWNDVDLKNAAHKHNDMRDF